MQQSDQTLVEIRRFRHLGDAEQHALVLVAMGIDCQIVRHADGIGLEVAAAEAVRAISELAAYARENRPRPAPAPRHGGAVDAALLYWAAIVFVQAAATRGAFSLDWYAAGAAEAGRIMAGEWWRTLTALGLHADFGHILSNLVAGGLLGLFVAQAIGAGLAWLAILLAAGIGNGLSAALHPAAHAAIGASTAVFAALGLLAALSWKERPSPLAGHRRWAPLAAGAMILAFTGMGGERVDIGGHVAGFLCGCVAGLAIALAGARLPRGTMAQWSYGAAALGLFAFAWSVAFAAR